MSQVFVLTVSVRKRGKKDATWFWPALVHKSESLGHACLKAGRVTKDFLRRELAEEPTVGDVEKTLRYLKISIRPNPNF